MDNTFDREETIKNYNKNHLSNYDLIAKETNNQIDKGAGWDYNCGGFALGTFEWTSIDEFWGVEYEDYEYDMETGEVNEDVEKAYLEAIENDASRCVDELLETYEYIRLINSINELNENEYAFVFRTGADDFHFMRRFSDGTWAHKRGPQDLVEIEEEEEVFDSEWPHGDTPYCNKLYMFACANQ